MCRFRRRRPPAWAPRRRRRVRQPSRRRRRLIRQRSTRPHLRPRPHPHRHPHRHPRPHRAHTRTYAHASTRARGGNARSIAHACRPSRPCPPPLEAAPRPIPCRARIRPVLLSGPGRNLSALCQSLPFQPDVVRLLRGVLDLQVFLVSAEVFLMGDRMSRAKSGVCPSTAVPGFCQRSIRPTIAVPPSLRLYSRAVRLRKLPAVVTARPTQRLRATAGQGEPRSRRQVRLLRGGLRQSLG